MNDIKPKSVIIDVTAGNRTMWKQLKDKDSPYIMFCDKQQGLKIEPDVYCNWRDLPFPDDRFVCLIFDPPHTWGFSEKSVHADPAASRGSWWGNPSSKRELVSDIIYGQREFARVAPYMVLKWNDCSIPLWNILGCLSEWEEIMRLKRVSRSNITNDTRTYWVSLKRK